MVQEEKRKLKKGVDAEIHAVYNNATKTISLQKMKRGAGR